MEVVCGQLFSMAPYGAQTFIHKTSILSTSPLLKVSLRFVASVLETDPLLVDLHGTAPKRYILPTTLPTLSIGDEDKVQKPTEYTLVAVFDRSGRYIYTGTSRGHFNVIDAETREVSMPFTHQLIRQVGQIISIMCCSHQTHPILLSRPRYLCQLC